MVARDQKRPSGGLLWRWRRAFLFVALAGALGWVVERHFYCLRTVDGMSMWPAYQDGDRLLVSRSGRLDFGADQRWRVYVYRSPGEAKRPQVKRLLAVAGETVDLIRGDVYIGADSDSLTRVFRSSDLVETMRVPIYPGPLGAGAGRFRVEGGRLRQEGDFLEFVPSGILSAYLIGSRVGVGSALREAEAISDDYPSATGSFRPGSHAVPDVRIEASIESLGPSAQLEICHELHAGDERRLVVAAGRLILRRQIPGTSGTSDRDLGALPRLPFRVRMQTLDGRFEISLVGKDGTLSFLAEDARNTRDFGLYSRVFFRVRGAPVTLGHVDISRDVFYVWPEPLREARQIRPGFVFLVGDNVPASRDCRQHGATPTDALVGRAVGVIPFLSRRRRLIEAEH